MSSIVMLGATGAVGSQAARTLAAMSGIERLTLLGRRPLADIHGSFINQHTIDIFDVTSYKSLLTSHEIAICTLGIGQPSKVTKEEFVRVDKLAVLEFARVCKQAGVAHFQLLGSVGTNPESKSFYLRTKGELEEGLKALSFTRLSLFHPSMILTPTNRYGLSQWLTLRLWPWLSRMLMGGLRKYRGIPVDILGKAIAMNTFRPQVGVEILQWDEFMTLSSQ